jgi:UDP-glucose 4-epimerase
MKKILIFGGYGFIGHKLYEGLKNIFVVKRYSSLKSNIYSIKYNHSNFYKIINSFRPDIIFFLSGTSHPDYRNKNHRKDLIKTNLVLQDMLTALKNNDFKGKFFYFSTIGVYGSSNKKKVNEKNKLNPESFYTLSKQLAEKQCIFFSNTFDLNINILRICSIFGPGLERQIIYKIIHLILSKSQSLSFLGNKNDKREFLFVDDLIFLIKKIIKSDIKNEIMNVGSNKHYKISELVNKLQKILKTNKQIHFKNKLKSPKFAILNNSKLNKLIKLKKNFDISIGLKKTAQYYKNKLND